MKAVTWHGKRDVRVETVPDPEIELDTDAVIEVTSTNICGSDLHLYEILGAYMTPGDILGHEPMGVVRELGSAVTNLAVGDRVVIQFDLRIGHGLHTHVPFAVPRHRFHGEVLSSRVRFASTPPATRAPVGQTRRTRRLTSSSPGTAAGMTRAHVNDDVT